MSSNRPASSDRRPAVGILTGSFHTDYSRRIAGAICSELSKDEVDVYLFQGLDASRFLNLNHYVDEGFDRHYYSQYEYSRFVPLDLLILSFGTISAIKQAMPLEEFLRSLPKVPVILLEVETDIPNGVHITVDNYVGMRSCIEHLVDCHGCRRPVYVSGPKGVPDAEIRLSAFRDVLRERGIAVQEEMICYGDFTDSVDGLVEEMLDRFPDADAVVCANDEMAESAYRVLWRRGKVPGRDIAVTGFDNNPPSAYMEPPMTTVRQSYRQVSQAVGETVRAYLRGESPQSVHLSAQLVVRQSCGCPAAPGERGEQQEGSRAPVVIRYRDRNKQLIRDNMLSALMLRNLLQENISIHSFFRNLGQMFHALGTECSWIGLLKQPLPVEDGQRMFLPEELRVHMIQRGEQVESFSRDQAPVISGESLDAVPRWDCPGTKPTAVFPLFYANMHYGVLAVSLKPADMLFYYALSLEIGTGLRYLYMAMDQQEARRALQEKNKILDFSASHDGLTGLYNRVGVMNQIYNYIREHGKGHRFVAVMADLDHLKQINDTFGHDAGDTAIKTATELLRKTLPPDSPLGRTGGDEFTALFLERDGYSARWFRQEIKRACAVFNNAGVLPYFEDVSVGCVTFDYEQVPDIPSLLKQADMELYEDKKQRRSNVIRQTEEV